MYCTVDEIVSEFKDIRIDTDTPVTIQDTEGFIQEESAFIDGIISSRYEVPIVDLSSPMSFLILKKICRNRVAKRIKHILYVKTGDEKLNHDLKKIEEESFKWLEMIKSGDLKLPDAKLSDTTSLRSFNADNGVVAFFDTRKQQW